MSTWDFHGSGDFFAEAMKEERIIKKLVQAFPDSILQIEQGNKMVSEAQIKFFDKLLSEKDFGDQNIDELRQMFSTLNQKSGSAWIESALKLPKLDESKEEITPAPFA